MLGVFAILAGRQTMSAKTKTAQVTDLALAYSRDGFHWHRPDRTPFLAGTAREGDWDRAYLHSAATVCTIVGDKLYFYYGGWSGKSPKLGGDMYAGGATGVAILRRDRFASLDAGESGGTLTTRPVTFRGSYLFANVAAPQGQLRAEVLDERGEVIATYSRANSVPCTADAARQLLTWKGPHVFHPLPTARFGSDST